MLRIQMILGTPNRMIHTEITYMDMGMLHLIHIRQDGGCGFHHNVKKKKNKGKKFNPNQTYIDKAKAVYFKKGGKITIWKLTII